MDGVPTQQLSWAISWFSREHEINMHVFDVIFKRCQKHAMFCMSATELLFD